MTVISCEKLIFFLNSVRVVDVSEWHLMYTYIRVDMTVDTLALEMNAVIFLN